MKKTNYNFTKDLDYLSKSDTYSLMLLMLFVSSDDPYYGTLNELAHVLDEKNLMKFLTMFQGQTIKVPTLEESTVSLKLLLFFKYYELDKLPISEALSLSGFEQGESYKVLGKLTSFKHKLEENNYRLGGFINGSKQL